MLSTKCRSSSIPAVHFKRPLPFPLTHPPVSFETNKNAPNHADPFHQTSSSFSPSRLGAFTQVPESIHFNHPHSAHSFCSNALKVSAKMGFLREGKQLHGQVVKLGLYNVQSLQIQILNVYVKCKDFNNAQRRFGEMLDLNDVEVGRQLHGFVVRLRFGSNCFVGSALVDLNAKHGLLEDRCAFDVLLYRDLVLWNVMVYCYASNSLAKGAFGVFNLMRLEGVKGDEFTFSSLLSSCRTLGSYKPGKQIHEIIIREAFDSDVLVSSALVDMYAKNDDIADAWKAFDAMSIRNVVSWTTIIVGYGLHGKEKDAIGLLREMFQEHLYSDELTLASIVSSCGDVSSASELMQVHAVKFGFHFFSSITNALITAYSKCGSISSASKCFNLVVEPDLVTWTSLICAYAFHGLAKEATEVFEKMLAYDLMPDQIAFLVVISACSHGGLIEKGLHYFKLMPNC